MFEQDTFDTSMGRLKISFVGHGTLMFEIGDKVIHVDPVSREADYSQMPKADLVLVTHEHGDHLDGKAIGQISKPGTQIIAPPKSAEQIPAAIVMENGDTRTVDGLEIRAVPAYNVVHMRDTGRPYHPRGEGNGYVLTFGDTSVYVAGDTENVPEIEQLEDIDVAFLPMNLPYTMTPEMVADVALAVRPAVLYPYHYGQTDVSELEALLADEEDIEVRIRPLQ